MEGAWDPEYLIMQIDASCPLLELLIALLKKKRREKPALACFKEVIFRSLHLPHTREEKTRVWKIVDFSSIIELRDF